MSDDEDQPQTKLSAEKIIRKIAVHSNGGHISVLHSQETETLETLKNVGFLAKTPLLTTQLRTIRDCPQACNVSIFDIDTSAQ